jgi:hypothetical protein
MSNSMGGGADEPNPEAIHDYFEANEGVAGVSGTDITFGTGDTASAEQIATDINQAIVEEHAELPDGAQLHTDDLVTAEEVLEIAQEEAPN